LQLIPQRIDALLDAAGSCTPPVDLRSDRGRWGGARASQRLAVALGVEGAVWFEGDVTDRGDVAARYAGADLFCLPSRHETFGFAFVEAMAAGLPVVAVDAGAAAEVLGDAGALVPPDDPGALAEAIEHILDDPALSRRLAEMGRERAKLFSWSAAAGEYLRIIRRHLSEEVL
jgi:glycosyltransferase involved in cell wall biosynthesis